MKQLLFGVHNHQPIGNFKHVFEHVFNVSYKPFIDVLYDYPDFKFSLHTTGPLWLFFESEHPELIELIREMVARGQVELVISGFYEPVLASIPHRDRVGQINMAMKYIKDRFGITPQGLWLTERVWESEIVPALVESGVKYVMVDDFHFLSAGKRKEELYGYYLTESEGNTLAIFPIDETLRYLVPFREVSQSVDYIKNIPGDLAIIFDDGEKFGAWPGTYEWVYEKKWLQKFVEGIIKSDEIKTLTYTEAMQKFPPFGRIYLPTASYFEMGEWSLPAEGALEFIDFMNILKDKGLFDRYRRFVRGGIWRNFLVKYEESNNLHKKMLFISNLLKDKRSEKMKDSLYKAQCNDAYWHGVFGGLYLPHLRKEIYENLIGVDAKIKTPTYMIDDFNKDGKEEVSLRNKKLRVSVAPHKGGTIYEISHFGFRYNFQDTLARRFEHYHRGITVGDAPQEGVASIHEFKKYIDEKSAKEMVYDKYLRYSLIDHFLPIYVKPDELRYGRYNEMGDFVQGCFAFRRIENGIKMYRTGVLQGEHPLSVRLQKSVILLNDSIEILRRCRGEEPLDHIVALELNLKLESPKVSSNGNLYSIMESDFYMEDSKSIEIVDDVLKCSVLIECEESENIYIYPVLTISQSEGGFDLVYQGSCILFMKRVEKESFKDKVTITFKGGKSNA